LSKERLYYQEALLAAGAAARRDASRERDDAALARTEVCPSDSR